jgi:hypothetical protein
LRGPCLGEQGEIGVGRDVDAARRRVPHHVEEARVHERLAQPLQVQLRHPGKAVQQLAVGRELQQRGPRAVLAELHRAHAAAQVAAADRLDLHERREVGARREHGRRCHG